MAGAIWFKNNVDEELIRLEEHGVNTKVTNSR